MLNVTEPGLDKRKRPFRRTKRINVCRKIQNISWRPSRNLRQLFYISPMSEYRHANTLPEAFPCYPFELFVLSIKAHNSKQFVHIKMRPEVFGQQVILAILECGYRAGVAVAFTGAIVGAHRPEKSMSKSRHVEQPVKIDAPYPAVR